MRRVEGLASRLKHRLELQEPVRVDDDAGGYIITWQKVADVWAEILPTRTAAGSETLIDGIFKSKSKYYITIRYINNIHHKMRLLSGEDMYNIRSVTDPDGGKNQLLVLAEIGVES